MSKKTDTTRNDRTDSSNRKTAGTADRTQQGREADRTNRSASTKRDDDSHQRNNRSQETPSRRSQDVDEDDE